MAYSSGDPFRDAMRNELDAIILAASPTITWKQLDTVNTKENPDASTGYIELEFPGGAEDQFTTGAPGNNLFKEDGQITVRVVAPLGRSRNSAELYASQLRAAFRGRRIPLTAGKAIRINAVGAMGGGHTEGGMWAEAIALSYQVFNVG